MVAADPKRSGGLSVLAALQRAFQAYVMQGNSSVEEWLAGAHAAQTRERLEVYRHAYFARLEETLQGDFKALQHYMGAESFSILARAYTETHPSSHASIRWFGGYLAEFLSGADPYRSTPSLSEIAAFEWALGLAFDASDVPVLTLNEMAALSPASWPAARIQFHPSMHRLDLEYDVPDFWKSAVRDGVKCELKRREGIEAWVVWRKANTPYYRALQKDEKLVFDALRKGATFEQACVGLCQVIDEQHVALRFAGLIKGWISEELVAGITGSAQPPPASS